MKFLSIALVIAGLLGLVGVSQAGEPKSKAKGTLTLAGTTYRLTSALAYEQTVFRKKETVVILSEKPIDTAKLLQSLKKNGNDDDFFPVDVHVKLSLDGTGQLLQLHVYAGGANIIRSGDPNVLTKATMQNATAKGTAGMKKADTFRDKPFEFEVEFDVAVIQAPGAGTEPKPSIEPKTKTTPKTKQDQPQPLIDKDLRIEGTLANNSPPVQGKPAQIHKLSMSADRTYIIDLESTEFDTYLRILDSRGKELARDDDSGGKLNARIRFTPPKEDTYQVVATRFGSGQGNYLLKIRVDRPVEEKQPDPAPVLADKEHKIEGRLANNSPQVMGKAAQVHTMKMSADKTYVIDLESREFDTYLRILDAGGKQLAEDDDGGEGLNSRIRFTPTRDGNYQIVATRFSGGQGNYLLKIRSASE